MPHIIVIIITMSQSRVAQAKDARFASGKGIEFPTIALKDELHSIIQTLKPTPCYVIDDRGSC